MESYYAKTKVPTARCRAVTTLGAAEAFLKEAGYPVIVKPDGGVDAANTDKLENAGGLRRFVHLEFSV